MSKYTVEEKRLATQTNGERIWFGDAKLPAADISAAADYTTPGIFCLYFDIAALVVDWSGVDDADGYIQVQASLDGILWSDLDGLNRIMSEAACAQMFNFDAIGFKFIRVKYYKGSNTAGTINFRYILKSRI